MLNSDDRRPVFDAWFASLDDATRLVFLDRAVAQWEGLNESEPTSVIDCMENIWDEWRDLHRLKPEWLSDDDRAVLLALQDPSRVARERQEREYRGLS